MISEVRDGGASNGVVEGSHRRLDVCAATEDGATTKGPSRERHQIADGKRK